MVIRPVACIEIGFLLVYRNPIITGTGVVYCGSQTVAGKTNQLVYSLINIGSKGSQSIVKPGRISVPEYTKL